MRYIFVMLCLTGFGTGSLAQPVLTYVATSVPVAIPDGPFGVGRSSMILTDDYEILDLNIVVTVLHTYDQDLAMYLEELDSGVFVRLVFQCGQSGDNYVETRFDDEASAFICSGSPPFTGSYRPEPSLSEFDHMRTGGVWEFRVTDSYSGDTGTIQAWRLEITADTTVSAHELPVITSFAVGQNYPNPFNATTVLPIELSRSSRIALRIFNSLGQTVLDGRYELSAGMHKLPIDGSGWSSGSYIARVENETSAQTVRLVLLK